MDVTLTDEQNTAIEAFISRAWYGDSSPLEVSVNEHVSVRFTHESDAIDICFHVAAPAIPSEGTAPTLSKTSDDLATLAMRLRGVLWLAMQESPKLYFRRGLEATDGSWATYLSTVPIRAIGLAEQEYQ